MYDYLDLRQIERLKELVPYKALAPDADEIIEELDRLNNIINKLETELIGIYEGEYALNEEEIKDKLKTLKEE